MIYITYVLIYNLYKYFAKTSTTISATAKTKRDRGFWKKEKQEKRFTLSSSAMMSLL